MIDRVLRLRDRLRNESPEATEPSPFSYLRAATAQLLLATAAGATLEHAGRRKEQTQLPGPRRDPPAPLIWAPALIGPLAAAAHLQHSRTASPRTAAAVRVLDAASLVFGGALFVSDFLTQRNHRTPRMGSLAFASAGLLGITLGRHEESVDRTERDLRHRADIVERIVPTRRARLDRIVVHV